MTPPTWLVQPTQQHLGWAGPRGPSWGQRVPSSTSFYQVGSWVTAPHLLSACPQVGVLDAIPITKMSCRGLLENPEIWKETLNLFKL